MIKSRILSSFRIEYRRNKASYQTEVSALRWVRKFLDEFSISHSSQIRLWQIEYFLTQLQSAGCNYDDQLQAKSALLFLMDRVLNRCSKKILHSDEDSPGVFKITG